MTKLIGVRTVYDTDPSKPFRVADVIEDGAILPHSVRIEDLQLSDLEEKPVCCCFEYVGDNKDCPIHGKFYEFYGFAGDDSTAWDKERDDLRTMGQGG